MTNHPTPSVPPAPEADSPPPEASGAPRRAWTILGRLSHAIREQNWFAVALEVLIVIVGVVVGFQVTGWGQARTNRDKEQVYLRQLAADLREIEHIVTEHDVFFAFSERAASQFYRAFRTPDRPPRDSLIRWRRDANWYGELGVPVGTIDALIATGDLALIRDDSLRSEIVGYSGRAALFNQMQNGFLNDAKEALKTIDSRMDYADVRAEDDPPEVLDSLARANPLLGIQATEPRSPFPFTVESILTDRVIYDATFNLTMRNVYAKQSRAGLLDATRDLRALVEAQIER